MHTFYFLPSKIFFGNAYRRINRSIFRKYINIESGQARNESIYVYNIIKRILNFVFIIRIIKKTL